MKAEKSRQEIDYSAESSPTHKSSGSWKGGAHDRNRPGKRRYSGKAAPVIIPGVSENQIGGLYEYIVRSMVARTQHLAHNLSGLASLQSSTKGETQSAKAVDEKAYWLRQAQTKFKIPINDVCNLCEQAALSHKAEKSYSIEVGSRISLTGRMMVFDSMLCYWDKRKEVQLSFEDIEEVDTDHRVLVLYLKSKLDEDLGAADLWSESWLSKSSKKRSGRALCYRFRFRDEFKCWSVRDIIWRKSSELPDLKATVTGSLHGPAQKKLMYLEFFGYLKPSEEFDLHEYTKFMTALEANSSFKRYVKGQTIAEAGETMRVIFHIISGKVMALDKHGDALVHKIRGDLFGEYSFFEHGNRGTVCKMVAEEDTECFLISYSDWEKACAETPVLGARLNRGLAEVTARTILKQIFTMKSKYAADERNSPSAPIDSDDRPATWDSWQRRSR